MTTGIVILGADGMLGQCWRTLGPRWAAAPGAGAGAIRFLGRRECDIRERDSIRAAITPGASVVINCAAWTDVDGAESNEALATAVNGEAPGALAERCREIGAMLVHYSTDYVFDGAATSPYRVDHPRAPINAYGRGKAVGEQAIERSGADHLAVIRTSWLYAAHGRNFVRTIARLAREKPSLRVVNDQRGRPTSCATLVNATQRLIERGARGFFHACDAGECSWFDLATRVAARVNPTCVVAPCATSEFPRPARRPAYSVLDLSRTENLIGPLPAWRDSLERVLNTMADDADLPVS